MINTTQTGEHYKKPRNWGNIGRVAGFVATAATVVVCTAMVARAANNPKPPAVICEYKIPKGWGVSSFASRTDATVQDLEALNGLGDKDHLQEGGSFKAPCSDELAPYLED
jgi:hypothetical protein